MMEAKGCSAGPTSRGRLVRGVLLGSSWPSPHSACDAAAARKWAVDATRPDATRLLADAWACV
jgi:hypothetical protein